MGLGDGGWRMATRCQAILYPPRRCGPTVQMRIFMVSLCETHPHPRGAYAIARELDDRRGGSNTSWNLGLALEKGATWRGRRS